MSLTAYNFNEGNFDINSNGLKDDFDKKGYIIVKNLLSEAEVRRVRGVLETGEVITKYFFEQTDGEGRAGKLTTWNHPGNDVTGMLARAHKVAGTCKTLLATEVYHYHTKLIQKDAGVGGKFVWHQDYGYWYNDALLFPDLMTVFIAIDPCRKSNGCMQVLEGSQVCGRLEHRQVGGQMGADPDRVALLRERFPLRHVEMEPGDALFFHCNVLHTSARNDSPERRWALLTAYNAAHNSAARPGIHPVYTRLHEVADSAILDCELDWDEDAAKDYLSHEKIAAFWAKVKATENAA